MQGKRFIRDRFQLDRAAHLGQFLSLILGNRGFLIGLGRSEFVPRLLNILVGELIAGIDLEGAQILRQRTSLITLRAEFLPSVDVRRARQESQSLVSSLIAEILWFQLPGLVIVLVGRDGIVFGLSCLAVGVERLGFGGRTCETANAQTQEQGKYSGQGPLILTAIHRTPDNPNRMFSKAVTQ
jgi:hypothetical protein